MNFPKLEMPKTAKAVLTGIAAVALSVGCGKKEEPNLTSQRLQTAKATVGAMARDFREITNVTLNDLRSGVSPLEMERDGKTTSIKHVEEGDTNRVHRHIYKVEVRKDDDSFRKEETSMLTEEFRQEPVDSKGAMIEVERVEIKGGSNIGKTVLRTAYDPRTQEKECRVNDQVLQGTEKMVCLETESVIWQTAHAMRRNIEQARSTAKSAGVKFQEE